MKLYVRTIFLLTFFLLNNNTSGFTQNVGYIRIIDNTDKSNDYKDCQYNRFDDLLINYMMKKGINIISFNENTIQTTMKSEYSGYYLLEGMAKNGHSNISKKIKQKLNLDYIIYFSPLKDFQTYTDIKFPSLECGSDLILKKNWSVDYNIGFGLLDLNENRTKKIIFKIKSKKDDLDDLTIENFDDQTNVFNFTKDCKSSAKKKRITRKY